MNAVPPSLTPGTTLGTWQALHDAAAVLAALADGDPAGADFESSTLPAALAEGPAWRRELFERSALDATAALRPAIAGLAALAARGAPPPATAQALWAEFLASRAALLALARQGESPPSEA